MTDISEAWNCNPSVHDPSSLKTAELSTFVNHAKDQCINKRILLGAPVCKAPLRLELLWVHTDIIEGRPGGSEMRDNLVPPYSPSWSPVRAGSHFSAPPALWQWLNFVIQLVTSSAVILNFQGVKSDSSHLAVTRENTMLLFAGTNLTMLSWT